MVIVDNTALDFNRKIKINFDGGDLTSDSGLLLIKEFADRIGLTALVRKIFKTNDHTKLRIHKDYENLMQAIYQIIAAYFEDDCADELKKDPAFAAILGKAELASQPTLSRFWNRMDEDTLEQFNQMAVKMRQLIYLISRPVQVLFDLDTTLLNTYGKQEGSGFNSHYQANGYHPLVCFDGLTGDLLKMELRNGTQYCSKNVAEFIIPLLQEYRNNHPGIERYLRGDSGFATPELYEACELYNCKYAIRLKLNHVLIKLAEEKEKALYDATLRNQVKYAVTYGEFMYQAKSWSHPRRVVFKIEKPYGQLQHLYTFVVTTFEDLRPDQVIRFYCGRGKMENFIKEGKLGFDFSSVSSHSMVVNANRLQAHGLAYNLFNWFRRLVLPICLRKIRIDTFRLRLLKIASKIVNSARSTFFKFCSSFPYKKEFLETLANIQQLPIPPCIE